MSTNENVNTPLDEKTITKEMVEELKTIILQEEQKVLHLRKHGMNEKVIDLIKARVK